MGRAQRKDQVDVPSLRPLGAAVCGKPATAGSLDANRAGSTAAGSAAAGLRCAAAAPGPGNPPSIDAVAVAAVPPDPAAAVTGVAAPAGPSPPSGFDQRVYAMVARIPPGQLATYGQIAELIGAWGAARQVGWALRRLPLPSAIPWQRVVNAAGRISMTPSREGSDWIQRDLLLAEGIAVDASGRLPLAPHRWRGEDDRAER